MRKKQLSDSAPRFSHQPRICIKSWVRSNDRIRHNDLLYLKWHYGISIQAILFRLRDLGLITNSHLQQWWIEINKLGWKKRRTD